MLYLCTMRMQCPGKPEEGGHRLLWPWPCVARGDHKVHVGAVVSHYVGAGNHSGPL